MTHTNIDIKKTFFKKRKGFSALVLALVVAMIGGITMAGMFGMSGTFSKVFEKQSFGYTQEVIAKSHIEKAKAYIVGTNNSIGVLHGWQNQDTNYSADINSLSGLLLNDNNAAISFDGIVADNGRQRVVVNVYDASYNPEMIKFTDYNELPPSFFHKGGEGGGVPPWELGSDGYSYEATGTSSGSQTGTSAVHERYGAYLIRVKIFNESLPGVFDKLVRTTEEAFVQVVQ